MRPGLEVKDPNSDTNRTRILRREVAWDSGGVRQSPEMGTAVMDHCSKGCIVTLEERKTGFVSVGNKLPDRSKEALNARTRMLVNVHGGARSRCLDPVREVIPSRF